MAAILDILKGTELFEELTDSELLSLAEISRRVHYRVGEVIFLQGSAGNELYIVETGKVAIRADGNGCNPATLVQVVEAGQAFGELALIDQDTRAASAQALCDSNLTILTRADLQTVFAQDRHIGQVVMQNVARVTARRLRKTNLQLMAAESWR